MSAGFDDLAPLSHDVIVADPPWQFETRSEMGLLKSADAQYETMTAAAIMAMPVHRVARGDCLLLLWTTGWAMATGLAAAVCSAWGFRPVTELVWVKTTPNGKRRMGPGYRARTIHEPILLGTIGNPRHRAFPSVFDGIAREHSRKPEAFYDLVEYHARPVSPLDLFSRQSRPGWTTWGHEAGKFDIPTFAGPIRPMVGSLDAAAPPTLPQAAGLDANFWTAPADASPGPSPHSQGSLDPVPTAPNPAAMEPCV